MNEYIPLGLSHLEGIYTGTQAVYFPIEITCPPDLPNSCWEPWELPNDPPDNSWGEIHEYDLIVKIEPTSHPAYFHYIQWFSGSSGNWHRQSGALIVIDYEYTAKNTGDGIRFFATNISSDYSINIEGDGIQHSEGLTEGVMRNASEIVIDYIGLEQQAVGTATLARAEIIGGSHEDSLINTNPGSINYLINRDGYPELVAMSTGNTDNIMRLYNNITGKHILSSNQYEIALLAASGWVNEGVSYNAPKESIADVFRFCIPSESRHFYTALESERDMIIGNQTTFAGWQYEGVAFSAYSTSDYPDNAVAVVRYINEENGNHLYSSDEYEQSLLDQNNNWINEGIAWYGDPCGCHQ